MLDSFYEEIRRKRNAYRIFWVIVVVFAVLLYMFFQGYYFSIRLGFEKLLQAGRVGTPAPISQSWILIENSDFLRSFGIVSLRVDPATSLITLNDKPYTNGDKKLLDYGKYSLEVKEDGYIPLLINIELSKVNPFYLNTVRLLEKREPTIFSPPLVSLERGELDSVTGTLPKVVISKTASGTYVAVSVINGAAVSTPINMSGALYLKNGKTGNIVEPIGTLVSLWERYFSKNNRIYELINEVLQEVDLLNWGVLCPNARIIRGDVFCPFVSTPRSLGSKGASAQPPMSIAGKFITGKYQGLVEPILEVHSDFFRTSSSITRLGGGFFNSSTAITGGVNFIGNTELTTYRDKIVLINNGRMYDFDRGLTEITIPELSVIETTHKFGDETLTIGSQGGKSWLIIEDGKNLPTNLELWTQDIKGAHISFHSGAYFLEFNSEVLAYYKGSPRFESLARGDILGVIGTTIIYNEGAITKSISLGGKN